MEKLQIFFSENSQFIALISFKEWEILQFSEQSIDHFSSHTRYSVAILTISRKLFGPLDDGFRRMAK